MKRRGALRKDVARSVVGVAIACLVLGLLIAVPILTTGSGGVPSRAAVVAAPTLEVDLGESPGSDVHPEPPALEEGEAAALEDSVLDASPSQIVFNARQGSACPTPQGVSIATWEGPDLSWAATSSASWLTLSSTSGTTPSQPTLTAACAGLPVGVHEATLTIRGTVGASPNQTVAVRAVINPVIPVTVAKWKDGHKGAFSSSTDDSEVSGYTELLGNGVKGTFVMNGTTPPAMYPQMYANGMELGSHLVSHYCDPVDPVTLRSEITRNMDGVAMATGSMDRVRTLVWPCGFRNIEYGVLAADYFPAARGYNINALEEATPFDLMNVKSYNSHEHTPFPPADLKSIADAAEQQGKWANLVLHASTNDDGAIAHSTTKDLWVAPIGSVIAYILQRDRTVINDYTATASQVSFDFSRLPVPASPLRDFERTITADDAVTLRVDVTSTPFVSDVRVAGAAVPFEVRPEGSSRILYFSSPVTQAERQVKISLSTQAPPVVAVSTSQLRFATTAGQAVADQSFSVSNSG